MRIPGWVEDYIEKNTDDEEIAEELFDYADCLINDEGITGDALEACLDEFLSCVNGTCNHYTCTEGRSLMEF